jgi:hypothetical protein
MLMSAVAKKNPNFDDAKQDRRDTLTARNTRFETAVEILAGYTGYLRNEIRAEKQKESPDSARVAALDEQCSQLLDERKRITFEDTDLINKVLYVYGMVLKALYKGS